MSYQTQYALSVLNGIVLGIAGVLTGAGVVLQPSWLSGDLRATAGIVVLLCGVLAHWLPPLQRTPATRDSKYLAAMAGALPEDVAKKHGLTVTREGDHVEVSSPQKPLDTL